MPQCKAGADLDRLSSGAGRLLEPLRKYADDRQRVMGIRISFIEMHRLQCGFHALLQIDGGIFRPTVGNNSGAYPRAPNLRFREFGIKVTSLDKQLLCFEMFSRVT